MVHAGPCPRAMFAGETKPRRVVSPLGIPKSPSFHSGLDLVASSDKRTESASDAARAFRFALLSQGGMGDGQALSPPEARSPRPSPERPPPAAPGDRETLMVQLPLLKGLSINFTAYCTLHFVPQRKDDAVCYVCVLYSSSCPSDHTLLTLQ